MSDIKSLVLSILPEAKLYLFGSRINGRWREDSDYDIVIMYLANYTERELIKKHDFGFKVDFRFSNGHNTRKCIEI